MPRSTAYFTTLTEAVDDITTNGFTSAERMAYWQRRLREAAEASMASEAEMETMLRAALEQVYKRMVDRGGLLKFHPGVGRYTLDRVKPHLRQLLDQRIFAAADLIKLNRTEAINKTLRRFSGWTSSIPPGGAAQPERVKVKTDIRKSLKSLPFEERRVAIDQGHKLVSSINSVVATDGGAIAATWRSSFRQAGYDYRPEHRKRDGKVFAIKGNWALKAGLMVPGPDGYTDDIEQPGEFVFCRCSYVYLYTLRQLPQAMLTKKGVLELERSRALVAAM